MKSVQLYNEIGRALRYMKDRKWDRAYLVMCRLRNEIVTIMQPGVDIELVLEDYRSTSEAETTEEGPNAYEEERPF